jgi:hypothetical protein
VVYPSKLYNPDHLLKVIANSTVESNLRHRGHPCKNEENVASADKEPI